MTLTHNLYLMKMYLAIFRVEMSSTRSFNYGISAKARLPSFGHPKAGHQHLSGMESPIMEQNGVVT